tara:strand:- start:512 stop:913 length:402 start_codon:yes stop_codon:yes gene_type:complete
MANLQTKIAFLILFLVSCTTKKKIIQYAEKNGEIIEIFDTVVVKEYDIIDTFAVVNKTDTILIENEKIFTRIIREFDTLRIQTQILPDTVQTTVRKIFIKPHKEKLKRHKSLNVFLFFALFLCLVLIYFITRK